jgi:hypothetical protein
MKRNEEIIVASVVLLSFIVMLVTALDASDILAFLVPGALALAVLAVARMAMRKAEKLDERSALCSLKATRNAFLGAVAQIAIYVALLQLTVSLTSTVDVLIIIWGVCVGIYLLSYFLYRDDRREMGA